MIPAMRLLILPLLLLLAGCSGPTQSFEMNQAIPVGTVTVTATGSMVHQFGDFGGAAFPEMKDKASLTVNLQVRAGENPPEIEQFLNDVTFSVRDFDDKEYKGFAMPEPNFSGGMGDMAKMMDDVRKDMLDKGNRTEEFIKKSGMTMRNPSWKASFLVPASAHHFKLHIKNRNADSGQPGLAIVDLRR